jgi:hypothetical protein
MREAQSGMGWLGESKSTGKGDTTRGEGKEKALDSPAGRASF